MRKQTKVALRLEDTRISFGQKEKVRCGDQYTLRFEISSYSR